MKGDRPVGVYVRLSDIREGVEAVSLRTQETDCRALAKRKGWTVVKVFKDPGRSAWKDNRDRPAFADMLAALEAGQITSIIAWKQDRLGRRVTEVAALLDSCRRLGAEIATVVDGLDTTTAAGRMAAQVIAASAEMESANTSARVARAMQARAERGDAHGGPRPYGYRRDNGTLVVDQEEAAVVREAVRRVIAGESIGALLRDFGDRSITTSRGGRWTRASLRNTLTAARIAGYREHDGRMVKGNWEPIVALDELETVRAVLTPSPVRKPRPRSFPLAGGILLCGRCNRRLKGRRWSVIGPRRTRRQYSCGGQSEYNGCPGIGVDADAVESFIASLVITRLSTPRLRARLAKGNDDSHTRALHATLRKLERAADDLAEAFGAGELDRRAYRVASDRNVTERRAVEADVRAAAGAQTSAIVEAPNTERALADWWRQADVQRRHALVSAVIDSIIVNPVVPGTRKFDPDRLEIAWRDQV
jgi:DNA invertase Pin-like site-specific DNA recombinase